MDKREPQSKQTIFLVQKMDCPTEENIIRNKLKGMAGIEELRFNLMQRELTVRHQLDNEQPILDALAAIGMESVRKGAERENSGAHPTVGVNALEKILVGISGAAALVAEISSWVGAEDKSLAVIVLSLLAIITGGIQTVKKAWLAVTTLTLNINFLMTLAVIGGRYRRMARRRRWLPSCLP